MSILMLQRLGVLLLAAIAAPAAAETGETLYAAMGGQKGVAALVDAFSMRLFTDAHIGPFFNGADRAEARRRLEAQFCELAGGPCKTINPDMKKTHSGMDITAADFDAVLNLLHQSMQERFLPVTVQTQLIERLEPLRASIVNMP